MEKVVGVRFKPAGKIYDFSCGAFVLQTGDHVVVSTEQGLGFGVVATPPVPIEDKEVKSPLKKVFRVATEDDFQQREKNVEVEKNAYEFCLSSINELGLEMNLFSVESTFDASKLTFFFTAEGRVDFRQLVKILVKQFRVRIEMRQVGIRNQAKMCGGLGRCGREICCSTFIGKFEPVSIKMAKSQGLSLNPTKISGLCGRLMCCLTFEDETYKKLKEALPPIGKPIEAKSVKGKVIRQNPVQNSFTVRTEDGNEVNVDANSLKTEEDKKRRE